MRIVRVRGKTYGIERARFFEQIALVWIRPFTPVGDRITVSSRSTSHKVI
ncbi:hypothetical protein QUA79_27260 [Microcoleus sp. F8-D1]